VESTLDGELARNRAFYGASSLSEREACYRQATSSHSPRGAKGFVNTGRLPITYRVSEGILSTLMQNDDVLEAIRRGDVSALEQFLLANPTAVTARVDGQRTLLHVATDWPGHFPHVRQTIHVLAAHGAALNAAFHGHHSETPLHWAASSDDLVALDALLELSADIESPGSVIDGGTPLPDAVAFRQWQAARRLIAHGARSTIWQAAALGMMDRLQQYFTGDS
jgi:ankyrin repeat protein